MSQWLPRVWDPSGYAFWFFLLGVALLLAERLRPWRGQQGQLRPQLAQDVGWALFNGLYAGTLIGLLLDPALQHFPPRLLGGLSWWAQFLLLLLGKDFIEWWVHRALHRVPWLWRIHRLHHSIQTMDWLGNMRFHPLEIVVYRLALWLPIGLLVVDGTVALAVGVLATAIGHLNHANVRWRWGPLARVLNGPAFHIWHHDKDCPRPYGCNFAIIFSCWDHLFGTVWQGTGAEQPTRLGFSGDETYPRSVWRRLLRLGGDDTREIDM